MLYLLCCVLWCLRLSRGFSWLDLCSEILGLLVLEFARVWCACVSCQLGGGGVTYLL